MSTNDQKLEDQIAVRSELMIPITLPPGVPEQQHPPVMSTANGFPMQGGKDVYLTKGQAHSILENLRAVLFNAVSEHGETLEEYLSYRESLEKVSAILRPCLREANPEKLSPENRVKVMKILDSFVGQE